MNAEHRPEARREQDMAGRRLVGQGPDVLELEPDSGNARSVSPAGEAQGVEDWTAGRLVSMLCRALDEEQVRYCHWKSTEALDRSPAGEDDLDLLVSRSDAPRFEEILRRLGFKQLPGVSHAYGLDHASGELVHIHTHYQLVIGDDMTKNYHLPIEEPYLASSVRHTLLRIPAPEFELGVFLLRMVVKHCSWDAILTFQGSLSRSERRELIHLLGKVDPGEVWAIMGAHLPFLPRDLWEACLRSVQAGSSIWFRIKTARRLQRQLVVCSRRGRALDTYLKMWRRFRTLLRRRGLRRGPVLPERLSAAGVLVAVVGGDGAGKSTAVEDLSRWLAKDLLTLTVHLGKPPRSLLSMVLKNLMGVAACIWRSPTSSASALKASLAASNGASMSARTHARLAWEVLTARDRYRTYRRARRLASNGAIVVCDRYPLREIKLMDGAVTANMVDGSRRGRLLEYLAGLERRFYDRITYPDILIVLRIDPELAVARKLGEERESFMRPRSEEIWRMDWQGTPAVVIDAGRPQAEVLSQIRSVIWSRL
jgi:thymidylate kinase